MWLFNILYFNKMITGHLAMTKYRGEEMTHGA
jgi:hypothetical protein